MLDRATVDSLFPADLPETAEWERRYPPRDVPEGALVTRFGPSPTGFVHIGGIYTAMVSRDLAHSTEGVYFLRIEDTDQAREVAGADVQFARAFDAFDLRPDEGPLSGRDDDGPYGPYRQSQRSEIYLSFVRELMRRGLAYPDFATKEELAEISDAQKKLKLPTGYYGRWAPWRDADDAEVIRRLEAGDPYVVRFRSEGKVGERVAFTDRLRGRVEAEDNHNDVVVLKTSANEPRLPTYHFAHVVDDHLMRTSLVVRGDEWLSSVPTHLQLFTALGFEQVDYAHLAPLMKQEGSSRRKLSKRKDDEASVDFYLEAGYPTEAVLYYLRGLANSPLAEVPLAEALATPLQLDRFQSAGPLVDMVKLADICADHIATLPAPEVLAGVRGWAQTYDTALVEILDESEKLALAAIDVERVGVENPRKDLARWSDFRTAYGFFFPALFTDVADPADERFGGLDPALVTRLAEDLAGRYVHEGDQPTWFQQIRDLAQTHGFAPNPKTYKKDPDAYPGMLRDAANVIRVLVTGAQRSPDLYEVTRVLGGDEVVRRLRAVT
ncbi:glutamate--tRNA ligase [Actinomycetospora termitidis]|uniref:Glutamate--tRNA ligase family protein n=1 Tax=Actinomycetospora termitidis TaxID=3053470 RepID=A0ABT7MBQ1_9PSEU|nr:glutamate--tRNA ligase family protein [Actinomycetospora sp. Odt1-22]MDL5158090.1 glutamate--tRNA ligase family protein [Actinomycetospora sp. Odt1-22]